MTDHSNKAIAARIKRIREAHDLSQRQLAELTRNNRHVISAWENARSRPTLAQALELALQFELTLDWIYLGREETLRLSSARRLGLLPPESANSDDV